jgi:hypothetical protein
MLLRFGTGAYQSRALPLSSQQMVNCYLEIAPPGAKTPVAVVSSYGITTHGTAGEGPIRGGTVVNGIPYVVSGNSLYRLDSDKTAARLGEIPGADLVTVAGDGANVAVAANGWLYIYNASTVSRVSDPDFPGASWVGFLDGFIPIIEPGSGRIWINETPYVPQNWNALDFVTAEAAPDDLLWGVVDHRELYAFGRETIEVFYNSGDADTPIRRTDSGFIEIGIMNPGAACKTDNGIPFLGNDGIAYVIRGYQPERISTHAMEKAIEGYADKSCTMLAFTEGGHKMAAFQFAEATWVYDFSTQLLHNRLSTGHTRWRPQVALSAFGKTLVGDYSSERIGYLNFESFDEWDEPMRASCTAPSISNENRQTFHSSLELQFEQGVGTLTTPDPQIMLDWSDDGGRTWSSEHWRSIGAMGAFKSRAIWRRLGRGRDRVYRYAITDKIRRTLIQAIWEGEYGAA